MRRGVRVMATALNRLYAFVVMYPIVESLVRKSGHCISACSRGRVVFFPREFVRRSGAKHKNNSDSEFLSTILSSCPNAAATRFIVRKVRRSPAHFSIRDNSLCGRPQDKASSVCVIPALLRHARTISPKLCIASILLLTACTSKPEIAIQSYCVLKATELIDMRDRGIRGLSEANKKAVLAGDSNWLRECKLGDRSNSGGPR